MRPNPGLDIGAAITELAVGEALVSLLDEKGRPGVTQRVFVLPPGSQIGPITPEQRRALIAGSLVAGAYEKTEDRESAYEKIKGRAETTADAAEAAKAKDQPAAQDGGGLLGGLGGILFGSTGPRGGKREGLAEAMAKSAVRTMGTTVGREIIRGVLGGLLGGGKRR
jgi:DNA helicase HerA-like ATPase